MIMAERTNLVKLGDICNRIAMGPFGSNIKVESFVKDGIPILNGKHLHSIKITESEFDYLTEEKANKLKTANAYRGDIIITHRGNIGQIALIPNNSRYERYVISQSQLLLSPNEKKIDPLYLTYFFHSGYGQYLIKANSSQVGVPSLATPVTYIRNLEIPLPPLETQKEIAHILGTLDDKIELNRRMNKTLEEIAQTLYKNWFIDFEFPNEEGKPYKSSGGEMVDSELGPIPKEWKVGTIGDVCRKPQYGFTASATSTNTGVKFLRITDINKSPWIYWSDVPYCDISYEDLKRYRLHKGDILIARMADPGQSALIEDDLGAVFASYLIRFIPINFDMGRYLQYWLRNEGFWVQVLGSSGGTTRISLNAQIMSDFKLVIPDSKHITSFANTISKIRQTIEANITNKSILEIIRNTLSIDLIYGMEDICKM